jgi:dienelactone hydrolase
MRTPFTLHSRILIISIVLTIPFIKPYFNQAIAANFENLSLKNDWDKAAQYEILGDKAEAEMRAFLLQHYPKFKAPTDVRAWQKKVPELRKEALEKVYLRGFPADVLSRKPKIVWGDVLQPDPAYIIRKLRYEIYPKYWIPALLYEPVDLKSKVPVVLNANGHHNGGKACDYKQIRCINLAKRGMLALNFEFIGMGELQADTRHDELAYANMTGLSSTGFFYLAMKYGLDILLEHPHADTNRVAMTGLSGGGWQTIVFSALDPRITLSVPVAGYTSIRARIELNTSYGDLEQIPTDLVTILDYQDMTAMLVPRPALLILNDQDDCCFQTAETLPVIYDAVVPTYQAFGALDRFASHNNLDPGTHNYEADNRSQFYKFLNSHFKIKTPQNDIHKPDEIYQENALNVGLPLEQETIQHIAAIRARKLAYEKSPPKSPQEKEQLRKKVKEIIRLPQYTAKHHRANKFGNVTCDQLKIGPFTVPFYYSLNDKSDRTTLVIGDGGGCHVDENKLKTALNESHNLVMVDIFGTGENQYEHAYQLCVESVGFRLLGIQVAHILSCAKEAISQTKVKRVHVVASGKMSKLAAIIAAALEPGLFADLSTDNQINPLRLVIEKSIPYKNAPSLFCFGLLEMVNMSQLIALMDGVTFVEVGRGLAPVRGR